MNPLLSRIRVPGWQSSSWTPRWSLVCMVMHCVMSFASPAPKPLNAVVNSFHVKNRRWHQRLLPLLVFQLAFAQRRSRRSVSTRIELAMPKSLTSNRSPKEGQEERSLKRVCRSRCLALSAKIATRQPFYTGAKHGLGESLDSSVSIVCL